MKELDAYVKRQEIFRGVPMRDWRDWAWQQQNAVGDLQGLVRAFPALSRRQTEMARRACAGGLRFWFTPYLLSLVRKDVRGNPLKDDPVWRQVFPWFGKGAKVCGADVKQAPDEYSAGCENWGDQAEMITPIAQHKYDNRTIVYVSDDCFGHCMYCFRALQSRSRKAYGGLGHWEDTVAAIKALPRVEEVILSGGDPLVYDNRVIGKLLYDLRGIKTVKAIRIHTRAWTYNPFRIDKAFCALLKKYEVTEMGVHVTHPQEMTLDFQAAVGRVRASGAGTMLMCDTPLIKGVNDDEDILRELFMKLYTAGVKPYYLSHCMPNIFAAASQRTSVKKGLRLMNRLKRRISNPAMPEYIITHRSGKKTVPECEAGTTDFIYTEAGSGWPVVRFKDWKGRWRTYVDGKG
jgi:lysine 2,3-aminomutase